MMWQTKLRGILARDDWELQLQAIIDAGQSLGLVRRALRHVLGMDRRRGPRARPEAQGRHGGALRDRRPKVRPAQPRAWADSALNARLPEGLRVQRSSSLWAAVARAIGGGQTTVMAANVQTVCPPGDAEEDEEKTLKLFLGKANLACKIYDANGMAKDRQIGGMGGRIGTLQLCCIYGHFHGAGTELSADERSQLQQRVPQLFRGQAEAAQGGDGGDRVVMLHPPAAAAEDPRSEDDGEQVDEEGPAPGVLKQRADRSVVLLELAMKRMEKAKPAAPAAPAQPRAARPGDEVRRSPSRSSSSSSSDSDAPLVRYAPAPAVPAPAPAPARRVVRKVRGTVEIPAKSRGRLIGRKGQHIRELEDRYKVNINVPKLQLRADSLEPPMAVSVIGGEEDVDACVAAIKRLYHKEIIHFESVDDFYRDVGTGNVWRLGKSAGLDVEWVEEAKKLVIHGNMSACLAAADRIRKTLQVTVTVPMDAWLLDRFRDDLQRELHDCQGVNSISSDGDGVVLTGQAEAVGWAEQRIWLWHNRMDHYRPS